MAIDLAILANEINTDPTSRGYAPHVTSGATNVIADLLNEVLIGIDVTPANIDRTDFFEAIDFGEVKSLGASERQVFSGLLSAPDDIPNKSVQELSLYFGPATSSRPSLQAIGIRKGSRAEELFGVDVSVRSKDVAQALGGP